MRNNRPPYFRPHLPLPNDTARADHLTRTAAPGAMLLNEPGCSLAINFCCQVGESMPWRAASAPGRIPAGRPRMFAVPSGPSQDGGNANTSARGPGRRARSRLRGGLASSPLCPALPRLGGPGVAGRGIAASRLLFLLPGFMWGKFTGGGADAAEA